jgi:ribosome-binding protein aMBF1 (putative translation factor)
VPAEVAGRPPVGVAAVGEEVERLADGVLHGAGRLRGELQVVLGMRGFGAKPVVLALQHCLIEIDKLCAVSTKTNRDVGPKGKAASAAAKDRARRSDEYREARDEYAGIRELRARNWIAAHIRERRYELDLTQQEVAERAGTSHSFISKIEGGDHIPTIPVLQRIVAVLDEELLIGIERQLPNEGPERELGPAPELIGA